MNKVRIGILGIGNMGSGHAYNIVDNKVKNMELTAVCDIKEARREWAKKELPNTVAVFDNAEEMMKSGLIDAVLVAVPHYDHAKYVMEAFDNGLHAICEKPAGVYAKQVREMNEAADKHPELTFAMMFNQRTNHVYRKMHELVQGGDFGQIKRVNWIITDWYRTQMYYDSGDWRATWNGEGGGVLVNQCPHQLDLLQWICGLPTTVQAHAHEGKWHNIEVEDDVTAYMEWENGATGVFVTTTGDTPGTNRFEVTLDKGQIICERDPENPYSSILKVYQLDVSEREYTFTTQEGFKPPSGRFIDVETDGLNPQHVGVLQAFTDHILEGAPLIADGREGIKGVQLSNAMQLSSWLDKTVTLPVDEDLFLAELNKKRASSTVKKEVTEVTFDTKGTY